MPVDEIPIESDFSQSVPRSPTAPPALYDRLRRVAAHLLARERCGHTLQATALVHELLLRSGGVMDLAQASPDRCVALAARAMRQILVNHALRRNAAKRGGAPRRVALDPALRLYESRCGDLAALDEALARLALRWPRQADVVELRFFGNLEFDAIARLLEISARTAERDWNAAREWLRTELERP